MYSSKTELPDVFRRYLKSLRPRLKTSTFRHHKYIIHSFHQWLDAHGIPLMQVDREQTIGWLNHLVEKGLKPASRNKYAAYLRIYLRWLHEHNLIKTNPEHLVKISDFPKIPEYLPRPLPTIADMELQRRLKQSDCRFQQGLLLMRWTGLRIGELRSLEQNCIRSNYQGNKFLKVPLGKLDNERLVPLDKDTVHLVEKFQQHAQKGRQKTWLLETKQGKKTRYHQYADAMNKACEGLEIDGKMTTHRLRHSYATSLLCAGMSLTSVMRLLGHRDIKMTLRYTAITQETVRTEYFEALSRIQTKYSTKLLPADTLPPTDPIKMLLDVERWTRSHSTKTVSEKRAAIAIAKRIQRIQLALKALFQDSSTTV